MSSVTNRIKEIKQPYGGYIKLKSFEKIEFNDGELVFENENIHGSIVGMAVDYLTRFLRGDKVEDAFSISLLGAYIAEELGKKGSLKAAMKLLKQIKGLDEKSIISACKLVTFDVWKRNCMAAMLAKTYKEIKPDTNTINNIKIFVKRGLKFFEKIGPIVKDGFTFEPIDSSKEKYTQWLSTRSGSYGGYTHIVESGDGDFLTADTLWDFKVSNAPPKTRHTLQILMYWIMGKHSGQEVFTGINKIGIFNPRLNAIYLLDVNKIPEDVIKAVEKDVIGYIE